MKLFLCEKPSQARDLARVLQAKRVEGETPCWRGNGVMVTHAIGHLLQQAMPDAYGNRYKTWTLSTLPVLPEQWIAEVVGRTRSQFEIIRALLREPTEVVVATDADREGEVIAREILDALKYRGAVSRLWVSDTTDAGIKRALATIQSGAKYEALYASGLGRSRADWLSGMNLTRALTTAFSRGKGNILNFGRVQTPTLALVVRRERAISSFIPKPYFAISARFDWTVEQSSPVTMQWHPKMGQVDAAGHLVDKVIAMQVVEAVHGKDGKVTAVGRSEERTPVPLLFYLGGLQKTCSDLFGFAASKTLDIVQALYQDHKATTYPRTDCEHISYEMFRDAPAVISALTQVDAQLSRFTTLCEFEKPSRAFNTAKVAASAHHAIIPTANSALLLSKLTGDQQKVYDLIRRRYIAQFLGEHRFDKTTVTVACGGNEFTAIGTVTTAAGWKFVYADFEAKRLEAQRTQRGSKDDQGDDVTDADRGELPLARSDQSARNVSCVAKATQTAPPKRYTQAALISAMESIDKEIDDPRLAQVMKHKEKAGIGTDATRGAILDKLFDGEYLAEQKKFIVPTAKGAALIELLERVCPDAVDLALTAIWEDQLANVERGTLSLQSFEAGIAQFVRTQIERIRAATVAGTGAISVGTALSGGSTTTVSQPTAALPCPLCGSALRQRQSARGPFWGCVSYPVCKATLPDRDGQPRAVTVATLPTPASTEPAHASPTCSACALPMRRRESETGAWWGCTGFPACRATARDGGAPLTAIDASTRPKTFFPRTAIGAACPTCRDGKLTQKALHGRSFAGCTKYPLCKHFAWL